MFSTMQLILAPRLNTRSQCMWKSFAVWIYTSVTMFKRVWMWKWNVLSFIMPQLVLKKSFNNHATSYAPVYLDPLYLGPLRWQTPADSPKQQDLQSLHQWSQTHVSSCTTWSYTAQYTHHCCLVHYVCLIYPMLQTASDWPTLPGPQNQRQR